MGKILSKLFKGSLLLVGLVALWSIGTLAAQAACTSTMATLNLPTDASHYRGIITTSWTPDGDYDTCVFGVEYRRAGDIGWTSIGSSIPGQTTYGWDTTVATTARGDHDDFQFRVTLGAAQLVSSGNFTLDNTAPVISALSFSPDSGTVGIGDTVTLNITANTDFDPYTAGTITINGKTYDGGSFTSLGGGNYSVTYTVASGDSDQTAGNVPASVTLIDTAGNESASFSTINVNTLAIDAHAPVISSIDMIGGVYGLGATITTMVVADEAGYTAGAITVNGVDVAATLADLGGGNYRLTYLVAPGDTEVTATEVPTASVVLIDAANNSSDPYTTVTEFGADVVIDTNAPVIDNVVLTPVDPSNDSTPDISFNVTDTVSGVDNTTISLNDGNGNTYTDGSGLTCSDVGSGTYTCTGTLNAFADGDYDMTINASDKATNAATQYDIADYTVDTVTPTSTDDAAGIDGVWQTSVPTVNVTWDDAAPSSGQAWIRYCTVAACDPSTGTDFTSYNGFGEGTTTFRWASADNAGNVQGTTERTIMVDTVKPAFDNITITPPSPSNDNTPSVQFDVIDETSGVNIPTISFNDGHGNTYTNGSGLACAGAVPGTVTCTGTLQTLPDGTYDMTIDADDLAGNSATQDTTISDYVVDSTAPTVTITNPDAGATFMEAVQLAVDTTDGLGVGVANCRYSTTAYTAPYDTWGSAMSTFGTTSFAVTIPTVDMVVGANTYHVVCADAAGNISTDQSRTFTYSAGDTTAPSVSLTSLTPSQTGAAIVFRSTEAGTAWIRYGLSPDFGNITAVVPVTADTDTTINLTGLTCDTNYYYGISAKDAANNEGNLTGDFDTAVCSGDSTAPVVTIVEPTNDAVVGGTVYFEVATDENATCKWKFGTTFNWGDGDAYPFTVTGTTSHSMTRMGAEALPLGMDYTMYVRCQDANGNTSDASTLLIHTDGDVPGIVTLQSPLNYTYTDTTSVALYWYAGVNATSYDYVITPDVESNGQPNWGSSNGYSGNITGTSIGIVLSNGTWHWRVQGRNAGGVGQWSQTGRFVIENSPSDTTPPTVAFTSPMADATINSSDVTVEVATTGDATQCRFRLVNYGDPYSSWIINDSMSQSGDTFSYNLTSLADGHYTAYARCIDASSNASDLQQRSFTITSDATAPLFVNSSPAMGAVNVSIAAGTATLNYNEELAWGDADLISMTRVSDGATLTLTDKTIAGSQMYFDYSELSYGQSYRITVPSGTVTDLAGNPAAQVDIYFTTQNATAPDITGLSMTGLTCNSGTINWSTDRGADSARYRYSTTMYSGEWTTMTVDGTSGTQALSSLTANTTYYYQVQFTLNGQTVTSVPVAFTTAASCSGIAVDSIQMIKTYATADNTYTNGWKWKFNITVNNMNETGLAMKFAQWVSGTNVLDAANNMQYSYDDATWSTVTANATYGPSINVGSVDNDTNRGGRQVTLYVQMKVPTGTAGGSYSTSYGIQSTELL